MLTTVITELSDFKSTYKYVPKNYWKLPKVAKSYNTKKKYGYVICEQLFGLTY